MRRGIPSKVIAAFKRIPLFAALSKRGLRAVVQEATELDIPAGKTVVREGDTGRHLYVILEGRASVARRGRRIGELASGEFFGELALLDHRPRSATVTAVSDMRVLVLGPQKLDVLIEREPAMARRMLQEMAKRVRTDERVSVD